MPAHTKISKFLSLVLRHKPDAIGVQLDAGGWALIDDLVEKSRKAGIVLNSHLLHRVVATSEKQRFSISPDGASIRANQGHSIRIELGLQEANPPTLLYHGTAQRNLNSILLEGLSPGKRNHVHLCSDAATALSQGKRHGVPVVVVVHSGRMHGDGFKFYQALNGVWLTSFVPASYVSRV